jgi:hypothetical protein
MNEIRRATIALADVVRRLMDAFNARGVDGFLALVTDGTHRRRAGRCSTIMRMSDSTELRYAGLFEVREAKVARAPHSRGPQRRGAVNWEESER